MTTPALQPIYNDAILYKQGGRILVTGTTSLTIQSCLTRSNTDSMDINIGDYFGARTNTVLNAAINGLNGLDTGTFAASKVYAIHAIADSAGYNPSGFLMSLSATAPVMPSGNYSSGYSEFRRIGWAVSDGSTHFRGLIPYGEGNGVIYTFDEGVIALNAGTSATQAAIDLSTMVPAVDGIEISLQAILNPAAASRTAKVCPSTSTIANTRFTLTGQVASVLVTQNLSLPARIVSSLPKIDYIMSNADSSLTLYVNGFVDFV